MWLGWMWWRLLAGGSGGGRVRWDESGRVGGASERGGGEASGERGGWEGSGRTGVEADLGERSVGGTLSGAAREQERTVDEGTHVGERKTPPVIDPISALSDDGGGEMGGEPIGQAAGVAEREVDLEDETQ